MRENELFEKQYGQKKLIYSPPREYWKFRRLLKKYDIGRSLACYELIKKGGRILDIGCNNGQLLLSLADKFDELYGMDISPSIIREAEKLTLQNIPNKSHKFRWVCGNSGEKLPFNNDLFDVVISIATLQFVYDLFNLLQEIRRVIRQNGEVIVQVPNIAYIERRFDLFWGRLPITSAALKWEEMGWDGGSIHYFTLKKLCWLFEINGFKVVNKTGSGLLAKFRNWWPSLLCGDLIIKATKA